MKYKAVAFDMDGTLLNANQQILPETIAVLNEIKKLGVKIILVTGRHHSVIYPYYHQLALDTKTICCNGSYIYDFKDQTFFDAKALSKEQAYVLLDLVSEYHIHTLIYTNDSMYYEVYDDHLAKLTNWIDSQPSELRPIIKKTDSFKEIIEQSEHVFKFATSSHNIDALKAFSKAVESKGLFECEWSWINRADVALKGNSKGVGLANWAKRENIDLSEIIAFGDNQNDLSMLKTVGLGVAMGNADLDIQKQAKLVIGDHNSSGIATLLTELFLSK